VFNNPPLAGLDLSGDVHPRRQVDGIGELGTNLGPFGLELEAQGLGLGLDLRLGDKRVRLPQYLLDSLLYI
jgi:hypothetical protein